LGDRCDQFLLVHGGSLRGGRSVGRTNIVEWINRPQGGWSFLPAPLHFASPLRQAEHR
jgi:hypothetical protein